MMKAINLNDYFDTYSTTSVDVRLDVECRLRSLPELERNIVILYVQGFTQAEIGEQVGYSRRNIGNILENIAKSA